MRTFSLPEKITPIWPDISKDDPKHVLRQYGCIEDVLHKRAREKFLEACEKGKVEVVDAYVKLGIDLEIREEISEVTPLTRAVEGNHSEIIRLLVKAGADIEGRDGSGDTPLMTSINWTNIDSARTLIELGADLDASDKYCNSSLSKALEEDLNEYVELLLEKGADPGKYGETGESVIHTAISEGLPDRLKMLLKYCKKPDLLDNKGQSLLGYAVLQDDVEIVEVLLEYGTDTQKLCNGWSLYDIALFHGYDEILDVLPMNQNIDERDLQFLKAAKDGDLERVKDELANGARLNVLDYKMCNAVHIAMGAEESETAIYIVNQGIDLKLRNTEGENVIGYCTEADTVIKLLELGVDPNNIKDDKKTCSLIEQALDSCNPEFLKALIDHGANIDDLSHTHLTFNYGEGTPESLAEAIKILHKAGADLEAIDSDGSTLLISAAYRLNTEAIKALVKADVNIDAKNKNGESALIKACDSFDDFENVAEIVIFLLIAGADYSFLDWQENSCYDNAKMKDNFSAMEIIEKFMAGTLETAKKQTGAKELTSELFENLLTITNHETFLYWVRNRSFAIVKGLLGAGFIPKSPSGKGTQALTIAIENEDKEIVKLLLEHGADPNTIELYDNSPYSAAVESDDIDYIKLLLDYGLDPNQTDDWCRSRLNILATKGKMDFIELLCENGASVEVYPIGKTPFVAAVEEGDFELCEWLLIRGANINIRFEDDENPLIIAVNEEKEEMVYALAEAGADLNCQNENGETALIIATKKGNLPIITMLLEKGADISIKDNDGESAISLASYREELQDTFREYTGNQFEKPEIEYSSIVDKPLTPLLKSIYGQDMDRFEELVSKDDVDETNYRGDTPLMIAVAFNRFDMMEILMEKGADVKKKNMFGDTAWSYSFVYKDESIRKRLEGEGSKLDMDALNQWASLSMRRDDIKKSFEDGDIPKIVSFIDKKELDINYLYSNQSPLQYARSLGDEVLLNILVAKGADVSLDDNRGSQENNLKM
ncbi:MAG: hypothetical protein GY760_04380 [Deltaproteobacteria bacterium]|nr:hypothetical protein [Deltaproteobacteria bacterium]